MFERMAELSHIIREHRKQRGSIDFDFPETKMVLDENGRPIDIKPYERNTATKMIEDFMLLANETVAEEYFWREIPFLYRTHETPDDEKIKKLSTLINNFGYHIHVGNGVRPMEVQKLLGKAEGTPEEALIDRLALRSMKQAKYARRTRDILVWRQNIIRILLPPSADIRIFRSTGSSKTICAAGCRRNRSRIMRRSCRKWRCSPV